MFEQVSQSTDAVSPIVEALRRSDLTDIRDSTITVRVDHDGNVQRIEQQHVAYIRRKGDDGSCVRDE